MTRRIGNTIAPRNPVARALATRRGSGAHQSGRTSQRQHSQAAVRNELEDWRDDVEFEEELIKEREKGSGDGPFSSINSHYCFTLLIKANSPQDKISLH